MSPVTQAGPLIGRDSEMAVLTGLVKEVSLGRGTSVLIEGEPGIGKSALVRALVAAVPEAGCQAFWGAGDELGQALPLVAFLDGLRVRDPSTNPRRNAIVRLLRGEIAADRGTDVPAALAEQLLALVTEQCTTRPTILVVDDLQWADPASITLWGRLARSARQMPLLLVGMMRPVPQREDLLALRRVVGDDARFQLTELTGAAVADLVATLAGGKPGDNLLRLADGAAATRSTSPSLSPRWPAVPVWPSPRRAPPSSQAVPRQAPFRRPSRTASASWPGRRARYCGRRPCWAWSSRSLIWRSCWAAAWRICSRRLTRRAPPACWPSPATASDSGIR